MWEVVRKVQELPPNESPMTKFSAAQMYERNQDCIMLHEARPDIPPSNPKVFSRAYGELNFEKIRRWLLDEDARMRIQAVDELIEVYIERREYAIISLKHNMLEILITMLTMDEVDELRERAGTALEILLRERSAQNALLKLHDDPLQLLLRALDDSSDGVVVVVLRCLIACHSFTNEFLITEKLVSLGCIKKYVELLERENVVVVAIACAAIVPIFDVKEKNIEFINLDGIRLVTEALFSSDAMLVTEASELLSKAAETPQGRRSAVKSNSIAALCAHVKHENLSARVAVCSALAQITILEEARFQAVDVGLPSKIVELLESEDERDVLAHVARLICHLAEYPKGREQLRICVSKIDELIVLSGEDVSISVPLQQASLILQKK